MSRRRTDGGGLLRRYGYRSAYAATGARCSDVTKGGTKSLALTAPAVAFSMRAMVFQSGRQTPRRQRLTLAPLTPISAPKRSVDLPTSFSQSPIVMVALCKCWTLKSSRPINAQWTIALCPRREVWFCCYAAQIMYAARMANRIRELREQRGWSSDHLATLVGVSGATIRRLELGDTKLTVDWMRTLSEALGCAPTDLLVLAAIAETEPEVVSYDGGPNAARTAVRRKGIEVYRVERSSLGAVGINPGDIVTVDESPEAISDVESGAVVLVDIEGALDRKSTRMNSSLIPLSRMPSSA